MRIARKEKNLELRATEKGVSFYYSTFEWLIWNFLYFAFTVTFNSLSKQHTDTFTHNSSRVIGSSCNCKIFSRCTPQLNNRSCSSWGSPTYKVYPVRSFYTKYNDILLRQFLNALWKLNLIIIIIRRTISSRCWFSSSCVSGCVWNVQDQSHFPPPLACLKMKRPNCLI